MVLLVIITPGRGSSRLPCTAASLIAFYEGWDIHFKSYVSMGVKDRNTAYHLGRWKEKYDGLAQDTLMSFSRYSEVFQDNARGEDDHYQIWRLWTDLP
jgi:hypothetical protein